MSITLVLNANGVLTDIIIPEGGESVQVVKTGADGIDREAFLQYDPVRDPQVRGYGRSRLASYHGDELLFRDRSGAGFNGPNSPELPEPVLIELYAKDGVQIVREIVSRGAPARAHLWRIANDHITKSKLERARKFINTAAEPDPDSEHEITLAKGARLRVRPLTATTVANPGRLSLAA